MARPRATTGPDSRARLVAAAVEEFARHGLAGASVDRIARRARLNKAMVYYHFANKEALYRETIRTTFATIGARMRVIQDSPAAPTEKLEAFVGAFVEEASRRPSFPRLVMRELSESGRHMDLETAQAWVAVLDAFFRILQEGTDRRVFRPVPPLFAFLSVVGPVVLVLASVPARERLGRLLGRALPDVDHAQLSVQARAAVFALLSPDPSSSVLPSFKGARHVLPASPTPDRSHPARRPPRLRLR